MHVIRVKMLSELLIIHSPNKRERRNLENSGFLLFDLAGM